MLELINKCPNCKSLKFETVFQNTKYDNDLFEFSSNNKLALKYPDIDFDELAQSKYSICKNCLLVFSTRRRKEENMYSMEFFADVQKRWYSKYPVPEPYINNHKKHSENFIEILKKNNFSFSDNPKILWIRSECGILPMELLKNIKKEDIYILEYFESNIRYIKENGFVNVEILPAGNFINPFKGISFTEIFLNHQLTHSFDPLNLTKNIIDSLSSNGKLIFYNEIDHIETNKMPNHYPRGINNFHNQLFTKNSLRNLFKTLGLNVNFFEPLESVKNASVHGGMFGIVEKKVENNSNYVNSINEYEKELNSFRDWIDSHNKYKRNLKISNTFFNNPIFQIIKKIIKKLLSFVKLIRGKTPS
jgi:hypothetical protein